MDEDFMVALQLQEQFDNEYESSLLSPTNFDENSIEQSSKKRKVESGGNGIPSAFLHPSNRVERPMSIVDESWEIMDPSPDVRAMFLEFNDMFFGGKLSGVEVKWSPRMTLCAGVCSYEGRGGLCSIRLSEPLLKLRPRRDLVQTLLHEMIHALLFVTQNNRDRDGHGPEFCKHMDRINTATGTKITVYHTFHDEVDLYRQHWWKCDGPCQNRKPYFGFVKRAMNRAPSARDPWWGDHQRTCGGTYNKVKEPEGYGKKKGKTQSSTDDMAKGKKPVGNAKPSSTTTASSGSQDIRNMIPFSGKGVLLGWASQPSASQKPPEPVLKIPFPSPVSSPKRPPFSPPSQNDLGCPTDTLLDSLAKNSSGALPLTRPGGKKPPTKRSVGNTKYFVSINGSPVRIPKPYGGKGGLGSVKQRTPGAQILNAQQRSVKELFDSFSITESPKPLTDCNGKTPSSPGSSLLHLGRIQNATDSSTIPRQQVNPPSTLSKYPSGVPTMSKTSPTKPTQSKYFGSQGAPGAASGSAVPSRKRSWDERGGSPNLLGFFSKKAGGSGSSQGQAGAMGSGASAASGSSGGHRKTATATVTSNTATTSSSHFPSSSSVSSSSTALHNAGSSSVSLPLMVSCPVCQAKVHESKINEHLDSCLF